MESKLHKDYFKRLMETKRDYKDFLFGKPVPHDEAACMALRLYEAYCTKFERIGQKVPNAARKMKELSEQYGTTMQEMKKHWRCIDKQNGDGE